MGLFLECLCSINLSTAVGFGVGVYVDLCFRSARVESGKGHEREQEGQFGAAALTQRELPVLRLGGGRGDPEAGGGGTDAEAELPGRSVKGPPAVQATPVQSRGREDPLEKGQATPSPILGLPRWLSW